MANVFLAIARLLKRRCSAAQQEVRVVDQRLKRHMSERGMSWAQLVIRAVRFALTRHEILSRASAIAYCAMLSFIPFITLVITVGAHLLPDLSGGHLGLAVNANASAQEVATVLRAFFPNDAANLVIDQIARIQAKPPLAVISITLVLALWTSSSLYSEIINSLNHILGVPESRPFWRLRLRLMSMVLMQTAVIFLAFVTIVAWPQIIVLTGLTGWLASLATIGHWLILFGVIFLSFDIVFRFGPDPSRKHHLVSVGSIFGTFVFLFTTFGFRLYLGHFARYSTAYGSLGGVMMLMFWFWLMGLVLLISAEINKLGAFTKEKN